LKSTEENYLEYEANVGEIPLILNNKIFQKSLKI